MASGERNDPAFLHHYANAVEQEAMRRQHQPEYSEWLMQCAERARHEAAENAPRQGELFQ